MARGFFQLPLIFPVENPCIQSLLSFPHLGSMPDASSSSSSPLVHSCVYVSAVLPCLCALQGKRRLRADSSSSSDKRGTRMSKSGPRRGEGIIMLAHIQPEKPSALQVPVTSGLGVNAQYDEGVPLRPYGTVRICL